MKTEKPSLFISVKKTKRGSMNAKIEIVDKNNRHVFKKTFQGLHSYHATLMGLDDYQHSH